MRSVVRFAASLGVVSVIFAGAFGLGAAAGTSAERTEVRSVGHGERAHNAGEITGDVPAGRPISSGGDVLTEIQAPDEPN